jgi:hypothetical protein
MEKNLDNKIELKDKLKSFYTQNKLKIYLLIVVLFIIFISIISLKIIDDKKNNLISEKYIKAGLYLTSDKKDKSKILYEEIILSKNQFYSVLALNTILEEDLISDKEKIINYFKIIEKLSKSRDQRDLIIFKKALYLIKNSNLQEGNKLLENLIIDNSKLKPLVENIIVK